MLKSKGAKMKATLKVAGLFIIMVLVLAAAAQISRQEFDELKAEVNRIKGKAVMNDIRLDALEKAAKPSKVQTPKQAPKKQARRVTQQLTRRLPQPLTGKDLAAWKRAEGYVRTRAGFCKIVGEATTDYMLRTPEGDYKFLFWKMPTPASIAATPPITQPQRFVVTILDPGDETQLRIYMPRKTTSIPTR